MGTPKYNPFRPNDVVNPAMFVGRIEELKVIEQCLFQTKNENPQHFLVQGERGIGKSSLMFYVNLVANGKIEPLPRAEIRFLSIPVDLGTCETPLDLIRKFGRGFKQAVGERQAVKETAKSVWDWLTKWEVLGVKFNKDDRQPDLEETAEEFVEYLASFCEQTAGGAYPVVPGNRDLGLRPRGWAQRIFPSDTRIAGVFGGSCRIP